MRTATFRQVRTSSDITRQLARFYADQIAIAGPIMGALWVYAYLDRSVPTPIQSPIGAHLTGLTFGVCEDIQRQLEAFKRRHLERLGKELCEEWTRLVTELSEAPDRLLAITVPLLVESQMKAISGSPHPAQDALIRLLTPVARAESVECHDDDLVNLLPSKPNAQIITLLHAGRVPYVLVCHPPQTARRWSEYLEAATVLLLPQVVVATQAALSEERRTYMTRVLRDQLESWTLRRPEIGDVVDRPWLPSLV